MTMEPISRRAMLTTAGAAGALTFTATPSWGASRQLAVAAGQPPRVVWGTLRMGEVVPEVRKLPATATAPVPLIQLADGPGARIFLP